MTKFSNRWLRMLAVSALLGISAGAMAGSQNISETNPYVPAYGHPYRHGAVPTREAHALARAWAVHAAKSGGGTSAKTLAFGGGVDGIGVTSGTPRVYVVFYGSQWGTSGTDTNGNLVFSNDPSNAAPYLQSMLEGLGTGGELWSGTMTQYCDGSLVSKGATSCPSAAPHVGYPSNGVLAGVWYDNSAPSPASATQAQLAQEAVNAAAHFGNTTAASNRYVQYVILSPTGTTPDGFNTSQGNFCAWHYYTSSSYGDVAYTNMPYVTDAGASCGENFVNAGAAGLDDGFSIVEGHEYAETITDQNPSGGWTNLSRRSGNYGAEDGDECAWISSGQGASTDVPMGNGSYAMQSTWSNDTNECDIAHPIVQ